MRIGLISDTHGLLRPEVFGILEGVERILHAGDIGDPDILIELEAIAPTTAVSGNTDGSELRQRVPERATLELGGVHTVLTHGHLLGSPTPEALAAAHPEAGLIVYGHTHRPLVRQVGRTLVVNPGSAGPRRFSLPISLGILTIEGGAMEVRLHEIEPDRR